MTKCALLYFGLTRTLAKCIEKMKENIFNVLKENNIEYDIFIHTYTIEGNYQNPWSHENTQSYINEDVKSILNPKHLLLDKQEEILTILNIEQYYTRLGNWTGMTPQLTKYLIRNMALALYSKKKITELFEKYKEDYDYVIFLRPDHLYLNKWDISKISSLNDTNIIISKYEWYEGCNDRFCIAKSSVALYYGKLFDYLLDYSRKKSIVSEVFLLDLLKQQNINIIPEDYKYEVVRIR